MASVVRAKNTLQIAQGEQLVLKANFANKIKSANLDGNAPTVTYSGEQALLTVDNRTTSTTTKKAQARFLAAATTPLGKRDVKFVAVDDGSPAQTVIMVCPLEVVAS